ncbi:MAG: hypothetical protein AMJ90_00265 [candidate division Zixibacteria bacterium SM23_73_2]|nr:MAG: hypothetical protein AMJ90_00265 [candidate division Zixibacteria bacterium SM23_73_2]
MGSLPFFKTKIVCTIGPASGSPKILEKLITEGMDVARLNFSHLDHETCLTYVQRIKEISKKLNRPVGLLQDLPGPKIRIGGLYKDFIYLKKGKDVVLTTKKIIGNEERLHVNIKRFPEKIEKGAWVYLSDGMLQLKVKKKDENELLCKVEVGGELRSRKGINFPGFDLSISAFTSEDKKHLRFWLENDLDMVCLSFVQTPEDIEKVKKFAKKLGKAIFLIAKIEKRKALENIDQIISSADGIMAARGDLGVEIPIEEVPFVQKRLIHKCNRAGKPVITATQMMESMVLNRLPTRAEATDVANAILDGTDAVMLSEETAIGKFPTETVRMMAKICKVTEENPGTGQRKVFSRDEKEYSIAEVISGSAFSASRSLNLKYIITPTRTGATPRMVSKHKPDCWILAFTYDLKVVNQLSLSYAVYPILLKEVDKSEQAEKAVFDYLLVNKFMKKGEKIAITSGVPFGEPGSTNSLRILTVY